ncbi:MAG: RAD55 family ATPase [Promethearchaeota archaeon]
MIDLISPTFVPQGAFELPRGSQLLLIGPPGVVKTTLALRYLADRLKVKEPAVFATTLWSPAQIRQTLSQIGGKPVASQLRIADGVSCVTAQPSKEPYSFQNLYDLNTISLLLLQAIADLENGHLCLDNLTTLMTYSAPLSVIKFLQVLCARVKDRGVTGIYLLEEGVHTNDVVATLRFSVDGVIEICDEEDKSQLRHKIRLHHLRGTRVDTRWLIYNETKPLQWAEK